MTNIHENFMSEALCFARLAASEGEVPVGAIIVHNNQIIGVGRNAREKDQNALAHAEMIAISEACGALSSWRLLDCDLYVTLEPCPMCAGAIVNSRIRRVIFGAYDPKSGALGSVFDINSFSLNHKPEVISGVLENECAHELSMFFSSLREKRNTSSQ